MDCNQRSADGTLLTSQQCSCLPGTFYFSSEHPSGALLFEHWTGEWTCFRRREKPLSMCKAPEGWELERNPNGLSSVICSLLLSGRITEETMQSSGETCMTLFSFQTPGKGLLITGPKRRGQKVKEIGIGFPNVKIPKPYNSVSIHITRLGNHKKTMDRFPHSKGYRY